MYVEKVQSDKARAIICQAAPDRLPSLMERVGLVMAPHVVEAIKVESAPFLARYKIVLKKMAEAKSVTAEKIETMKRLKVYVRHARRVLDKRVVRGEMEKHDLILYGARQGAKWDQASTYDHWIGAAHDLVDGEALGTKKGLETLSEPKACELEALYEHARTLIARSDALANDLLELEYQQRPVRKEINQLINELRKMVVLETRNNTTVWRVLLRAAGYTIRYHKHAEQEEGEEGTKRRRRRKASNPFYLRNKDTKREDEILRDLLRKARERQSALAEGLEVGPLELPEKTSLKRQYQVTLPVADAFDATKTSLPMIKRGVKAKVEQSDSPPKEVVEAPKPVVLDDVEDDDRHNVDQSAFDMEDDDRHNADQSAFDMEDDDGHNVGQGAVDPNDDGEEEESFEPIVLDMEPDIFDRAVPIGEPPETQGGPPPDKPTSKKPAVKEDASDASDADPDPKPG